MTEADLQRAVCDAAEWYGWKWLHVRPGRTLTSWITPTSGPLGTGWPDLLLVKPGHVMCIELKAAKGRLTPEQHVVHDQLRAAGLDVRVVRPADLDQLIEALKS